MKRLVLLICALLAAAALLTGCSLFGGKNEPTVNGTKISEYSIVYSEEDLDYSLRAAEYIKSEILARTGVELALVEDSDEAVTEHEIVVGETAREISARLDADTEGVEFAILAEETQIALEGDYFVIAAAAYYFVETYIPSGEFDTTVPKQVSVHTPITEKPDNFIFLIGDGMGPYQARMFDYLDNTSDISDGEDTFYGFLMPYIGTCRTDSLSGTTDSAAAGTALACGIKTVNGMIGQSESGEDVTSLTELAISLGKKTAVMSTEASTGATPATFSAHAANRDNNSDILQQQAALAQSFGTIVDCNYNFYKPREMPAFEKTITDVLDKVSGGDHGFFLMYEEAHIDKNSHSNDMEKTYLSLIRFNQAIGRFMEFAFYNPNTFLIITADHETGDLRPDEAGELKYNSEEHTSADVFVFAYGDGAEVFNGQNIENIQIPQTIADMWGKSDFGDQSTYGPLGN